MRTHTKASLAVLGLLIYLLGTPTGRPMVGPLLIVWFLVSAYLFGRKILHAGRRFHHWILR